jgi:hypothetical protein
LLLLFVAKQFGVFSIGLWWLPLWFLGRSRGRRLIEPRIQIRPVETVRAVIDPGMGNPLLAAEILQLPRCDSEIFGSFLQIEASVSRGRLGEFESGFAGKAAWK